MNKNKLIMSIIGGVAVVSALALAYLAWMQVSVREEAEADLENKKGLFDQNRDATRAEERAIRKNVSALREWMEAAVCEAATLTNTVRRIEMSAEEFVQRATEFQSTMRADVNRYQKLPENAVAKIVADGAQAVDQTFPDFKEYITGGRLPERAVLVRWWVDICLVIDTLLDSGAESLMLARVVTPPPSEPDPKARGRAKKEADPNPIAAETYEFVFRARPDALVNVLNALAAAGRFVSVDELSFAQDPDPLLNMLDGSDKKKGAEVGGRRRRRQRTEVSEAAVEAAAGAEGEDAMSKQLARSGTVTNPADPLSCTPFKVTMKVSTLAVRTTVEVKK